MVFEARFERARTETSPSAVLCPSAQPESTAARGCAHVHPHLIDGQQESDEDTVLLQIAQAADIGRAREAEEGHAVKNMDAGVQSSEEPNSSRLGVEQLDCGLIGTLAGPGLGDDELGSIVDGKIEVKVISVLDRLPGVESCQSLKEAATPEADTTSENIVNLGPQPEGFQEAADRQHGKGELNKRSEGHRHYNDKDDIAELVVDVSDQDGQDAMPMSERRKHKRLEVFVGGLDKDATEDNLKQVFRQVGEVTQVRLMRDVHTGKNKGYAFIQYSTAAQAKRAAQELVKIEVRGQPCGVLLSEENGTLFVGNVNKTWTKQTDALLAFRRLQLPDVVFGTDRSAKVAWAQPLNQLDEDVMLQVKSAFVEGMPPGWDEDHVEEHFWEVWWHRARCTCPQQRGRTSDSSTMWPVEQP